MTLIPGESDQAYFTNPAVSWSRLRAFVRSPLLYQRLYVTKKAAPLADTPAMHLGRAAHKLILEGEAAYLAEFSVLDKPLDRRTLAGKALWEFSESQGKPVIRMEEDAEVRRLRAGVLANPDAARLLRSGLAEVTVRVPAGRHRFERQGRIDWLAAGAPAPIVDLKTCQDLAELPREIEKRGYYRQMAYYVSLILEAAGGEAPPVYIIGVEKEEPYRSGVWLLSPELLGIGEDQNERDLLRLAECLAADTWPGGMEGVRTLAPSDYLMQRAYPAQADLIEY